MRLDQSGHNRFSYSGTIMKKLILSTVALVAMAGNAFTADLRSIKSAPAVDPEPSWKGFYVGLNAGGEWANTNNVNIYTWPTKPLLGYFTTAAPLNGGISSGSSLGLIGGGQVGYNLQTAFSGFNFVVGLETDFQGLANSKNTRQSPFSALTLTFSGHDQYPTDSLTTVTTLLAYLGTVRGRVGILAIPSLLLYGTAGLAYGGVNVGIDLYQRFGAAQGSGYSSHNSTSAGWTAGGGAEWMFLPNWTAKAEYLYYDLGYLQTNANFVAWSSPGAQLTYGSQGTTQFTGNIIRAGVNYHFDLANFTQVVAKF